MPWKAGPPQGVWTNKERLNKNWVCMWVVYEICTDIKSEIADVEYIIVHRLDEWTSVWLAVELKLLTRFAVIG